MLVGSCVPRLFTLCNGVKHSRTVVKSARLLRSYSAFTEIPLDQLNQPDGIKVRGRPHLPGSHSPNFPDIISKRSSEYLNAIQFNPSTTNTSNSISNIGRHLREHLDERFNNTESDAVYISNLPIKTPTDFKNLLESIGYRSMNYASGSGYRTKVKGQVYTASEEPPLYTIEPHFEMAYLDVFPTKIILCSMESAPEGGESPIVFRKDLERVLSKEWMNKVKQRGIRYLRNLPHEDNTDYVSWQATFETKSEQVAEDLMQKQSMFWNWLDNGDLTMWYKGNVFIKHPKTGEEIWFNQMTASHSTYFEVNPLYKDLATHLKPWEYSTHVQYEDGEEFEVELMDHLRTAAWNIAVPLKLEYGDVLVLDNLQAQHSRMGYTGNRKILFHLCESVTDVRNDYA